jgi:hypothetical protein
LASSYPGLAIPKGRTRKAIKRDKDAHEREVIHGVYLHVSTRDRVCRFTSWPIVQMNEIVSRAKTMRMAPERRFNGANCIMLSPDVHALFTAGVIAIVPEDVDAGADGTVRFVLRDDTSPLWRAFVRKCQQPLSLLRWVSQPGPV